jgi:hypothetical protein
MPALDRLWTPLREQIVTCRSAVGPAQLRNRWPARHPWAFPDRLTHSSLLYRRGQPYALARLRAKISLARDH